MPLSHSFSKPISYSGGLSTMTMNDGDSNSFNIQYSPKFSYSIGYTGEYWRENKYKLHVVQVNYLLKRWNNPSSQGNLYLESGIGVTDKSNEINPAAFTGITSDWEDRRFLVSYKNRLSTGNDIDEEFMQQARVGITPYIGKYGDLHTWIMIEAKHTPRAKEPVTITPIIRLFKDTNMLEIGFSNQNKILFNFMKQF